MNFGEWIRFYGFWALDFFKGSSVRRHYADVQFMLENYNSPQVSKKHEEYLRDILDYARQNIPYYKNLENCNKLADFPVINKNIIKGNYESFQALKIKDQDVIFMHTSGSTGTPFFVRQDQKKRDRVYAEMIYLWGKAGYRVGMCYLFLRVWTSINQKNQLETWARNMRMLDIRRQDDSKFEEIRTVLKEDHKIKMILGYASTLDNLADYLLRHGTSPGEFKIQTIIGFGESFPENTHIKLKEIFNCQVVSLYSNQENGILGEEFHTQNEFQLNYASYHIELLEIGSNTPVKPGNPGRVVVTDLFNHAMPLIRYDTGDIAMWKSKPECGWDSQVITNIQGSTADFLFDTKGNKMSSDVISVRFWQFDRLLQFQFIQEEEKKYVLKLNGVEGQYEDAVFVELVKSSLGDDAEVIIEHVNEIPILESGKRKSVVCKLQRSVT